MSVTIKQLKNEQEKFQHSVLHKKKKDSLLTYIP